MSSDKKATKSSKNVKSNEELYVGFQTLRNEQRTMALKLTEMEAELNEHKIVIDTLKTVEPERKCYRMIGGILCERTVKEVMPALTINKDQLTKYIETLNEELTKKGIEINEYKEKHNINIRAQDDMDKPSESNESKQNNVPINPIQV